jgi:hypothetical protein
MNKYSGYSTVQDSIDLHNLNGIGKSVSQNDVRNVLDDYFQKMAQKFSLKLKKGFVVKLGVIVGKGTRSKNTINGKNPLRAFTEEYLNQVGYNWRNGRFGEGEDGVIVVEFDLG